ncbi:MAG TPA: PH domain-containing protein [Acidimicrobiales bacterium]
MSWRKTGTTLQSQTIAKAALPLSAIDLCLLLTEAVMLTVRGRSMYLEFELGGLVFVGTAIFALGWIWLFLTGTGVERSNDGITVRNWLRTYEIPWQDVSGFTFGDNMTNPSIRESIATPALQTYVLTADGQHRVMSGLQASHVKRSHSAV